MCKVFAIYPTDKKDSTKFLNKINTFLCKNLGADWHCYKIKFSDEDHQRCLNSAQSSAAKFIIFMGHGRGDKLLGSFNKKAEDFISNDALSEELFYKNEKFIHEQNIDFFKNKILFLEEQRRLFKIIKESFNLLPVKLSKSTNPKCFK